MKNNGPANVRLPDELKDRIKRVAEENGLSMSDIVRLSLICQLPEIEAGTLVFPAQSRISTISGASRN